MASLQRVIFAAVVMATVATALPATSIQEEPIAINSFWKGTPMDSVVDELRSDCVSNNDTIACIKFRVLNVLDQVLRKDSVQVTDTISVVRNSYVEPASENGRSEESENFIDSATQYLKHHDVLLQLPGAKVSLSPRSLEADQLDIKLDFSEKSSVSEEGRSKRKGKLRKLVVPIMVFILLKAMTLIPLAIGVLGLKAWNALQLSFFSFVISIALAIFQLCKKIAADSAPAQLSAHVAPWDGHYAAARAFEVPASDSAAAVGVASLQSSDIDAHNMAYRGH